MNRLDYYFKQPVSESELDLGFQYAEDALHQIMADQSLSGIFSGGTVAQHASVADLTVDVGGPCYGYDANGQRLSFVGPIVHINCAQDSSSVSTTVAGGGNQKWLSLFLKFKRVLSDPRVDGNSVTVQFERTESYEIDVIQGAEAAIGVAVRPPLDPDAVLLCDIDRRNGQTQILNANIDVTRRQDVFVLVDSPLSIRAGTPKGAVLAMLNKLNDHINGVGGAGHTASGILSTISPAFADAATIAAGTVQSYMDAIVTDVAATGGAGKIGSIATGNWANGSPIATGTVRSQIDAIVSQLAATAGAARLGFAANAGSPTALANGTVQSQVVALQVALNAFQVQKHNPSGLASLTAGSRLVELPPFALVDTQRVLTVGADRTTTSSSRNDATGWLLTFGGLLVGDIVDFAATAVLQYAAATRADVYVTINDGGGDTLFQYASYINASVGSTNVVTLASQYIVANAGTVTVRIQLASPDNATVLTLKGNGAGNSALCARIYRP